MSRGWVITPRETGSFVCVHHAPLLCSPPACERYAPPTAAPFSRPCRWTLCATDRCFKNGLMSAASRTLKILPVDRGAGIEQGGMKAAAACLQRGEWVHIFPEGTRGAGENLLPMRAGVGKLVHSCWEAGTPLLVSVGRGGS